MNLTLISICYDKAHNTTLIRRCFSAIYFEIILFIALNSPNWAIQDSFANYK
jgi:hypothetical protein